METPDPPLSVNSELVIVAVDVPTGVDASSAVVPGGEAAPTVRADLTITFGALTVGQGLAGEWEVAGLELGHDEGLVRARRGDAEVVFAFSDSLKVRWQSRRRRTTTGSLR